MSFRSALERFQAEFHPALAGLFDSLEARPKSIAPAAHAAFEVVRDFTLEGGKRLRPFLMTLAYEGYGGSERARALRASCSIELMQTFLLMHDDLMDRSDLRRGAPTAHRRFEELYRGSDVPDLARFGASLAILAGDTAAAYGALALTTSGLPAERSLRALRLYSEIVADETFGQILDMQAEFDLGFGEEGALRVFYYKTTRYTIEGPLHLGAALAGAADAELEKLSAFAVPLGNAFQLQDDVLGLYGDESKLGKPVGSDLKEGKRTLLIVHALAHASDAQAGLIRDALGNQDLTPAGARQVQETLEATGSRAYARRRIAGWIDDAKTALGACAMPADTRASLLEFADYLVERDF